MTKSSDLELYRKRVEELYSHQNWPLNETIHILQAEGCTASRNMLLKKIAKWGLRKYKPTQVKQGMQEIPGTSLFHTSDINYPAVTNLTLPSRIFSWEDRLFLCLKGTVSRDLTPFAFLQSVEMAHPINQAITKRRNSIDHTIVSEFFTSIHTGVILFLRGDLRLGGASLERGFRIANQFLLQKSPLIWNNFIALLSHLHARGFARVAEMVIKHLFLLSKVLFGTGETSYFLEALQHCHTRATIGVVAQACSDMATAIYGFNDGFSVSYKLGALAILTNDGLPFEEANRKYEELLDILDKLYPPRVSTEATVRMQYSILLGKNNFHHKGLSVLLKLAPWMLDQEWPENADRAVLNRVVSSAPPLLDEVMKSEQFENGDIIIRHDETTLLLCEHIYKKLYDTQCSRYGKDSEDATVTKLLLINFYKEFGKLESYSRAMSDIFKIMESFKLENAASADNAG